MTSGEAYNLAKDKIRSLSFKNKHKRSQIVPMHPDVIEQAKFIDRTVKMMGIIPQSSDSLDNVKKAAIVFWVQ